MVETVGMGVIGLGKIGRLHAAHLANGIRGARLAAVCDADPATLAWGTAEFGAPGFSTPEELLAQDFVDGVVIASTAETHADIISAAAYASKHVFSEKPVALTLERIDRHVRQSHGPGRVAGLLVFDDQALLPDTLNLATGRDRPSPYRPPGAAQTARGRPAAG